MQTMFAMGSLYMIQDVGRLLRCILVNSTYSSSNANPCLDAVDLNPKTSSDVEDRPPVLGSPTSSRRWSKKSPQSYASQSDLWENVRPEQPVLRTWFRAFDAALGIILLAALITGILGNSVLIAQRDQSSKVAINQAMRCALPSRRCVRP